MKGMNMTDTPTKAAPRREFLKNTARLAAASALAGVAIPHVHAAEDNTIRLALIGCGGRGSGAIANAMSAGGLVMDNRFRSEGEQNSSAGGPIKLIAMADLFQDRLDNAHKALHDLLGDKIDVPKGRQFLGFDAYRKAIDCLRPGDVALLTTHAAFRATHLEYAVEKGVNVFMEKSFAPDPGGVQQILRAGAAAEKKNLKIAAGLMCRHSAARQAMIQRIRDGAMGQIQLIRAYRMDGGYWMPPMPPGENELLGQIRRATKFLWTSSGFFLEYMIHQIDECCWIKDSWPVAAHGVGGRCATNTDCSQDLDSYSIEYSFADGTKAYITGRYIPNCFGDFVTYVHGTKCAGQFSGNIHAPTSQIYKDQHIAADNVAWKPPKERVNPWQAEWESLLHAIRNDKPHNEARRAGLSNLAAIMGRAAVHCGKIVTWEEASASQFRFCPNVAGLTTDSPAPVRAGANGRYPVPVPGAWSEI
jgi:predicted dehydrogenase